MVATEEQGETATLHVMPEVPFLSWCLPHREAAGQRPKKRKQSVYVDSRSKGRYAVA